MVDVVERLGKGLAGIQWWNSQSRVANMASIASRWSSENVLKTVFSNTCPRVGSAVVEPYINYYKNLLPSSKYRRNLGSKLRQGSQNTFLI